jgi:hypothetical protein
MNLYHIAKKDGSPGNRVVFRGWKRLEENAELKV